jgi:fatty acid-binding protein DegV
VSLLGATLGTALDIKPILHCHRGETGPVAKVKGFEAAAGKLFDFVGRRVAAGLMTPTVALSYGGELEAMRALPGYARLRDMCATHQVELFESVMSLTGMVNVGKGALVAGFAGEAGKFE